MSDENTHAIPDSSQESEQRRNIAPKTVENSVDCGICLAEPKKRRRSIPKTREERERVKYLKHHTSPLRSADNSGFRFFEANHLTIHNIDRANGHAMSVKEFDTRFHGEAAFLMAYQSWTRDGNFHPHIHVIVAGGALSYDSTHWIHLRNPNSSFTRKPSNPFSPQDSVRRSILESSRNNPKKVFSK